MCVFYRWTQWNNGNWYLITPGLRNILTSCCLQRSGPWKSIPSPVFWCIVLNFPKKISKYYTLSLLSARGSFSQTLLMLITWWAPNRSLAPNTIWVRKRWHFTAGKWLPCGLDRWLDQYNTDTKHNSAEILQFFESHLFIGCDAWSIRKVDKLPIVKLESSSRKLEGIGPGRELTEELAHTCAKS